MTPAYAEDVAQEAALKAWRHRRQCRTPERLTVRAAVAALDDLDQALMELRYGADLTNGQIANVMRLPEGTVKVRLLRARARLRAALQT